MRAVALAFVALAGCSSSPDVAQSLTPTEGATTTLGSVSSIQPIQPATANCREFTTAIKVGDQDKRAFGRACEQSDGSWKILPVAPPGPALASAIQPMPPADANCREFTASIKVGGEQKPAYGRACEQPDGAWQIVTDRPQQPVVVEHHTYRSFYDPWWPRYNVGIGVGIGFGHHHHHH